MTANSNESRILFINPTGWQQWSINLGLAYLAGSLRQAAHDVLILDLVHRNMSDADLIERVREFAPGIIGISVKTSTARESGRLAELLSSSYHDACIIAGGPHVTLCAEDFLSEYPEFDFGLLGEADESIVQLVNSIDSDLALKEVPGLAYRSNGAVIVNPRNAPTDLERLPYPDLDAIDGFCWKGSRYPVLTSRGCPFQCVFCCVNKITGSKWRARSPKHVVDELEYVALEKGVYSFEILDDNFTLNVDRAKEVCRELMRRDLNLSWDCHNGIRADRIDDELAALMKEAGCASVAFGMESGHPDTFGLIKKGEPLSAIINAVGTVKAVGMETIGSFIIGLPGDTLEKFIETVRFQRALNLDGTNFSILVPYPKTEVWDVVQSRGRMLADITDTVHLDWDLVPVTFEMPEFPKRDMIRAFYIARYFELCDATRTILDRGEKPVVIYMESEEMAPAIPGMIIACEPETKHIIVRSSDVKSSVSYDIETADVEVVEEAPKEILRGASAIYVCLSRQVNKRILFSNSYIIGFRRHKAHLPLIEVRRSIGRARGLPQFCLTLIANVLAARDNAKRIGIRKAHVSFPRLVFRAFPRPMQDGAREIRRSLLLPRETVHFRSLKASLKDLEERDSGEFPFDNHPSHM